MKILAFAATNSKKSINAQLVQHVSSRFNNADIDFVDLNHFEMPIYSMDREIENGVPDLAVDFAKKIDASDLIIISFAEHNGTYTTAFKNIFDWISRIPGRKAFGDKNIFALATSNGPRGAQGVLDVATTRFPYNGGYIVDQFSLPHFSENFNPEKGITHLELEEILSNKIDQVKLHLQKVKQESCS
ncbi:NADPH-dependent FMN reductase [Amniculibacterium aquaticum]|jgi:NAD(P)H-dependent FMN reductase|uniref:NADPH-dependent FMN reductase n=1 Tax=Amniculibacterium aquaticum TaxID=2479858 RepID=UPI000F5B70E7|nr:NAD(P)H-dependent oxidoreductase [Amniculibacterium aquaticum]